MFAGSRVKNWVPFLTLAAMLGSFSPAAVQAQETPNGHFGILLPLVTRTGGETVMLHDRFSIGFPMGIIFKVREKVAVDFELVPTIQRTPLVVGLTVQPGILYTLENDLTAGLRMAFDAHQASWGFTPLVQRKLQTLGTSTLFGELVVPIRFQAENNSVGIGIHGGVRF